MIFSRWCLISLVAITGCTPLVAPKASDSTAFRSINKQTGVPSETAAVPALPATAGLGKSNVPLATTTEPLALKASESNGLQLDVWQRIRDGFAMHEIQGKSVERYQKWYADRPDYVGRVTERAERYLYFIVEEVEKRGMPMEIALLPIIESAFNPGAYSGAHASGIWQFIPSTGKNFGLEQNWWYDGRRDIISATNGALNYLQKLHGMFGDWELALAAYNCGENAVQRAQASNRKLGKSTNYSSLKLPRETRDYVPKLQAVKNIISNPGNFGISLRPISNKPYFVTVISARHIDVKLAAELADISLEEFQALNPAHNRPVILQENADVLLLPVDKVETFNTNLKNYNAPLVSWQEYKSEKGERLDKLAPSFGMSVEKLRKVNGLPSRIKVSNGQKLLVSLNGEDAEDDFEAFNTYLPPSYQMPGNASSHIVRKGDTLNSIGRRYHVSVANLKRWNKNSKIIRPGQRIYLSQINTPQRVTRTSTKKKQSASKARRINYQR